MRDNYIPVKFLLMVLLIAIASSSNSANAQPANGGPASPAADSIERLIPGGTLSPAYQIDNTSRYIPDGYFPSNSYCFSVFFEIVKPAGGDDFQIWAHENQWIAATNGHAENKAHVRCFRPSPMKQNSFVKIFRTDAEIQTEFQCTTQSVNYCEPTEAMKKLCEVRGLEFVATGPATRPHSDRKYDWFVSWVLCSG